MNLEDKVRQDVLAWLGQDKVLEAAQKDPHGDIVQDTINEMTPYELLQEISRALGEPI